MVSNKLYILIALIVLGVAGYFGYMYVVKKEANVINPTINQKTEMKEVQEKKLEETKVEDVKTSDTEIDKELDNLDKELDLELEETIE